MSSRWSLLGILLACWHSAAFSEGHSSLQGLDGVEVLIENIDLQTEDGPLKAEAIHAAVEGQLSQAGIPVLSRRQALVAPGKPYLYINLNAMGNGEDGFVFSVSIELKQEVELPNHLQDAMIAVTWKKHHLGATPTKAAGQLRQVISDQVNAFIVDYQQANRANFTPAPVRVPLKRA